MEQKLADRMQSDFLSDVYIRGFVSSVFADDVLGLDGVWWQVATRGMNAPRGVIVPSKIYSWSWTKIDNEYYGAGYFNFNWQPKNTSSGVYFYRLQIGHKVFTKKMILLQ